jgi:hypothetical protein
LLLAQAMSKGNLDVARVHAQVRRFPSHCSFNLSHLRCELRCDRQNAIREKSQSLNFLKLGSRIDGVCSRLEAAVKMNTLTESMKGVVKGMDVALKSMDAEKVTVVWFRPLGAFVSRQPAFRSRKSWTSSSSSLKRWMFAQGTWTQPWIRA